MPLGAGLTYSGQAMHAQRQELQLQSTCTESHTFRQAHLMQIVQGAGGSHACAVKAGPAAVLVLVVILPYPLIVLCARA